MPYRHPNIVVDSLGRKPVPLCPLVTLSCTTMHQSRDQLPNFTMSSSEATAIITPRGSLAARLFGSDNLETFDAVYRVTSHDEDMKNPLDVVRAARLKATAEVLFQQLSINCAFECPMYNVCPFVEKVAERARQTERDSFSLFNLASGTFEISPE
jgi:hypothetical protein